MPVHDWARVNDGTFHGFHTAWMTHLSEALNNGLLPPGYYALPEQHAGRLITDVLTLEAPREAVPPGTEGGVAVADAPPRVRRKLSTAPTGRAAKRTLTIRHVSGHRVVALLEIVSKANKDRASHVAEFADKAEAALRHGIHLLIVDLLMAGVHDPSGMNVVLWERFDDEPYEMPAGEPFTLAYVALGVALPSMPLFLTAERYVPAPLETTYTAAFRGLPAIYREMLEA